MKFPFEMDAARAASEASLALSGASDVEIVVVGSSTGLTRYANSEVIQNTTRCEVRADVRVSYGGRSAVVSASGLGPERIMASARSALEAARALPEDPEWQSPPAPAEAGAADAALMRFDAATAVAGPTERSRAVAEVLGTLEGMSGAGIFETGSHAYSVLNSKGLERFDAHTRSVVTCLADTGEGSGWGDASSHAMSEVDPRSAARTAVQKAMAAGGATDLEPGDYEVVLEPAAVASLLEFLAYCGMSAKQVIEGDSFLATRQGDRIGPAGVTVADDVRWPGSIGIGFDLEGVERRRVPVIEDGIATGPVLDRRTARKLDEVSTGHFSGSTELGPYASNVVLEPGPDDFEDLVSGVGDGVLVTRFHYVNVLDRPEILLTGMTRDGTFRIRDGEVAGPVRNLRFAQSFLDALASVTGIGSRSVSFPPEFGHFGSCVAPALRIGRWRFSSGTSH